MFLRYLVLFSIPFLAGEIVSYFHDISGQNEILDHVIETQKMMERKEKETKISFSPSEKRKNLLASTAQTESAYKTKCQNSSRKVQVSIFYHFL